MSWVYHTFTPPPASLILLSNFNILQKIPTIKRGKHKYVDIRKPYALSSGSHGKFIQTPIGSVIGK